MILANVYKHNSRIYSFSVESHGSSFVCAAVSMLVINTINAIDEFLDVDYTVDINEKDAIISFESHETFKGIENQRLDILLDTLLLGLQSTKENYSDEISLKIEEVQ